MSERESNLMMRGAFGALALVGLIMPDSTLFGIGFVMFVLSF